VADLRAQLLDVVTAPDVLKRLPEPVRLASGEWSSVFIDGKYAVSTAYALDLVGRAMWGAADQAGVTFSAVGGLELGAVPFTFAVAGVARCNWFLVRKQPKGRGTNLWVEGAHLGPGTPVMLVDDVVTTGGSIVNAHERVREQGAEVVFASTLVDRGDEAKQFFAGQEVPYQPMLTYEDLGIEPVRRSQPAGT
jgi:orotate phosphoribosyltransferase